MQVIGCVAVYPGKIIVDLRAAGIDALAQGMHIEIVDAGEVDAKLRETQRTVVAFLFGADKANVGDGESHLVPSVVRPVIS